MNYRIIQKDELYHHGILGMKWGIRRFQNEDGTYNSVGKARYGIGDGESYDGVNENAKEPAVKGLTDKQVKIAVAAGIGTLAAVGVTVLGVKYRKEISAGMKEVSKSLKDNGLASKNKMFGKPLTAVKAVRAVDSASGGMLRFAGKELIKSTGEIAGRSPDAMRKIKDEVKNFGRKS